LLDLRPWYIQKQALAILLCSSLAGNPNNCIVVRANDGLNLSNVSPKELLAPVHLAVPTGSKALCNLVASSGTLSENTIAWASCPKGTGCIAKFIDTLHPIQAANHSVSYTPSKTGYAWRKS
jgi:hypothetical protein